LHQPPRTTIIDPGRQPIGHTPGVLHMTVRPASRLAAALVIPVLIVAACGGSTASTGAVASGEARSTGVAFPSGLVLPSGLAIPSDLAIPSFDLGSLVHGLDNVDSYKITIVSAGGQKYAATVVTKPVVAKDLTIGSGDSATHIVTIGDESWMGTGAEPLQSAPNALVGSMLGLFDPTILLAAFGNGSVGAYADNVGTEDKNGQPTTHYRVDAARLAVIASFPPSATIDFWVADDGYLVSVAATDFGTVGTNLAIDVTKVNDPANVVAHP
jgi:hypothetical protein